MTPQDVDLIARRVVELLSESGYIPREKPPESFYKPSDLVRMGYEKHIAYHPRLIGRFKRGTRVGINKADFDFAVKTGKNLLR